MYSFVAKLSLNVSKRTERLDAERFQAKHKKGECLFQKVMTEKGLK